MPAFVFASTIIISALVLIKGVTLFIGSTSKIARALGISGYTISFLLVATSTSMPEALVGVNSALDKTPILSFGNAIGANIALLTFVIALPILLNKPIRTHTILASKDIYYMAFFSTLPLLLSLDGMLTRFDGAVLLSAYILYASFVIKRSHGLEKLMDKLEHSNIWKQIGVFLFSLGLILAASRGIVDSAENLSLIMGLSLGFVGLSITAIGTSLPELTYTLGSARKNKQDEVLGDITGSVVANSTFVLGIASLIHPINIRDSDIGATTILFMMVALIYFIRATRSRERLEKGEAIILILIYITFLVVEYTLQTL